MRKAGAESEAGDEVLSRIYADGSSCEGRRGKRQRGHEFRQDWHDRDLWKQWSQSKIRMRSRYLKRWTTSTWSGEESGVTLNQMDQLEKGLPRQLGKGRLVLRCHG